MHVQDSALHESATAEKVDDGVLWTSSSEFFRIVAAEKKKLVRGQSIELSKQVRFRLSYRITAQGILLVLAHFQ